MRDHQRFEKDILPNGITLYSYRDRFRTVNLDVLFPVGAAHSHPSNGFIPGSAHFLEHIQLIRSSAFPEPYQLDRELGLLGGHSDGTTYPCWTEHWIDAPVQQTDFATRAFVDRVFHPVFQEGDFATERTVIMNERNQRKFYPGRSASSQYFYTQFLNDTSYPIEQMFGSDDDLASTHATDLQAMHGKMTASEETVAIAVGSEDFSELKKALSEIPTDGPVFTAKMEPTTWAERSYKTAFFETISQPTLKVAWLHPRATYEEAEGLSFIISLLINTTHGPLYEEFREERGWVYGLEGFCSQRENNLLLGLTFPVNQAEQVQFIRECLLDRIRVAVFDQDLVEHEIMRCMHNQVYNYQTAGEIISSASRDLMTYGRTYSEKEWMLAIKKMVDPAWRIGLWERYFKESEMGEVCFMPERRKLVPERMGKKIE